MQFFSQDEWGHLGKCLNATIRKKRFAGFAGITLQKSHNGIDKPQEHPKGRSFMGISYSTVIL